MFARHIKQNVLSAFTLAFSAMATISPAQDTSTAIDWSDLDSTKRDAAATDEPAAFKITECPVNLFEDAYGGTIDAANVHAAAALELEVLRVCTKRQDLADQLQKNNRRLREDINIEAVRDEELQAFLAWRNLPDETRAAKRPAPAINKIVGPTTEPKPSSSFSNSNAIAEEENALHGNEALPSISVTSDPTASAAIAAQEGAPKPSTNPPLGQPDVSTTPPAGCAPEYLVELSGHQREGDGTFVWATLRGPLAERFVVRAGDQLPGGIKIKSVSREVVLITTKAGTTEQLAKAPESEPEPNDASFSYTLIKQDQASGVLNTNSSFVMPRLEDLNQ